MKIRLLIWVCFVMLGSAGLWLSAQSPVDWLRDGEEDADEQPVPQVEEVVDEAVQSDPGAGQEADAVATEVEARDVRVYVVPIQGAISPPNAFILRRSIKQAMDQNIDVIVLDMDTPGGRLDVTFDIMEMLARFGGETITYVNKDAISAGAYISMVTDAIYFAPDGVMGAAAVVAGGGQEIDESMKAKINSYLLARMRSYTERHPYRGEIIRAMADMDYELEIDGVVLSPKGELLSLTAVEAVRSFGTPPRPLLADGIAGSIEELLEQRYGGGSVEIVKFELTWSEHVARYLDSISPLLLGIGLLALFIEFKTPGFGIPGMVGIALILTVFASNYIAGLAGLEAVLFFVLGLIFIAVEIFLLPGTLIFLGIGILLVIGSLIWSLMDIWPALPVPGENGGGFEIDPASFWSAMYEVTGALAIALVGLILVWRFLPSSTLFSRIVHQSQSASPDPVLAGGGSVVAGSDSLPDIGALGVVSKPMHPVGQVMVDGKPYQATVAVGGLDKGERIRVVGYRNFALLVELEDN
ncbi:MAG: hypothetical protein JJU20_04210 [Opitutales bacterium]|nr:hypothetical protein [Opitutales bacterium]